MNLWQRKDLSSCGDWQWQSGQLVFLLSSLYSLHLPPPPGTASLSSSSPVLCVLINLCIWTVQVNVCLLIVTQTRILLHNNVTSMFVCACVHLHHYSLHIFNQVKNHSFHLVQPRLFNHHNNKCSLICFLGEEARAKSTEILSCSVCGKQVLSLRF